MQDLTPVISDPSHFRLQLIDSFEPDEKETVIKLLDAMIAKHNMESTVRTLRNDPPTKKAS